MIAALIALSMAWLYFSPRTFLPALAAGAALYAVSVYPAVSVILIAVVWAGYRIYEKRKH